VLCSIIIPALKSLDLSEDLISPIMQKFNKEIEEDFSQYVFVQSQLQGSDLDKPTEKKIIDTMHYSDDVDLPKIVEKLHECGITSQHVWAYVRERIMDRVRKEKAGPKMLE
jgi:hypothetical protein